MNKNLNVGIIGAGIQGISNALFLQKKGFKVTIFDREKPGSPVASYGNAGHFSPYASLSLNRADILMDVPAMLLSSTGPLALKWNYVPKMIPWFLKFIFNTTKNKMMHTAKNMHQILDLALPAYDELFEEINLENLVENKGILYVWNNEVLDGIPFSPETTNTYVVIGTAANGCLEADTVEVVVNPLPVITANAMDDFICYGESTILWGEGADSYIPQPIDDGDDLPKVVHSQWLKVVEEDVN